MLEIIQKNLEVGHYVYRDSECSITIECSGCGHYIAMIVGLVGITGMHYETVAQLYNGPFDWNKFSYSKYHENQIIEITPLDKS